MGKKPEVSLEKRAEINVLLSEGMSQKEIASKLEISQSAVSKIIKRIIEFGTYAPKPRPGRPRVRRKKNRQSKNTLDIKTEDTFNSEDSSFLSDPLLGLQEDNFFLSLCEIENTIKKENEKPNKCESPYSGYENGFCTAMKREKPEISQSFEMEENIHFGVSSSQEGNSSSFVKLEGRKKIKSEFKRPSNVMSLEEKHRNFIMVEDQRIHHVKTEDKRPNNFIKTEVKPRHALRLEEEMIPHRNIKLEKDYYYENNYHNDDNDDDDNDRNDYFEYSNYQDDNENAFYSNNCQSDNEISYHNVRSEHNNNNRNQNFYSSFSNNRPSQTKKKTGYLRIYDKSIKRRPHKSDIQIKPTTFVKISERKRSHDKRNNFKSTSPQKIRFKKERF